MTTNTQYTSRWYWHISAVIPGLPTCVARQVSPSADGMLTHEVRGSFTFGGGDGQTGFTLPSGVQTHKHGLIEWAAVCAEELV